MFRKETYTGRRNRLAKDVNGGIILFLGNDEIPMNYKGNTYRFRQDSSFLYFFGLDLPGLSAVIDCNSGDAILFGNELDLDDIIWMGPQPSLGEQAEKAGIDHIRPINELQNYLMTNLNKGQEVHYLPPYHESHLSTLATLTNIPRDKVLAKSSEALILAVVDQRSIKSAEELSEMEKAQHIASEMHTMAMRMAKPGLLEREIAGAIEGIALSRGNGVAFPVILSVRGEILHNHYHGNKLKAGDLVINDSGAESDMHYASDITRTFPANGKFSKQQSNIYQIVLSAQMKSIGTVAPEKSNKDIHLYCARLIADGLKELGLMQGDMEEAVQKGAHALFFPHGIGHMIGLDVHDMEGLGEDKVGYSSDLKRSEQFGLAYLRLAKTLRPGYVLTIEPGIYFIPELINKWKTEKKFSEHINYTEVEKYIGFGGIRIEDNVVVSEKGNHLLGKPIPKTISEIEETCNS